MEQTWDITSTAEGVELVPEFFYLPEFLLNVHGINFGLTQDKQRVDDVVLPTWAGGDPRQFALGQRQVLESVPVSLHLDEWINLIFGCKQSVPLLFVYSVGEGSRK